MPLGDWLDRWLEEYVSPAVRESTQRGYRQYIECYIKSRLGDRPVCKVTAADVQDLYREVQKNGRKTEHPEYGYALSGSTIRSLHGVFHQAMDAAVQERLTARNPIEGVTRPKKKATAKQILNDEQLERFMEEIRKDPVWHDFFYTELTTGMRRGELLTLQWSDLDFKSGRLCINKQVYSVNGRMEINEPKTKAAVRTIILPPAMVELLAEYKTQVFSEWMFPSRVKPEQPVDPGYVRKRLQVILERAGCKRVRFHDLRHTFATMSLENGMDVKTLSTIIGYVSSATTLNIYTHITGEMQRNAARNIDQGIAGVEVQEQGEVEQEEVVPSVEFTPAPPQAGDGLHQPNQ